MMKPNPGCGTAGQHQQESPIPSNTMRTQRSGSLSPAVFAFPGFHQVPEQQSTQSTTVKLTKLVLVHGDASRQVGA